MATNARTSPRGRYRSFGDQYREAMAQFLQPIPRGAYAEMSDDALAAEIKRLYLLRKAEQAPRIALDMRLLRWYDPEKLSDTWQSFWNGKPIPKLYHNSGLATENIPWASAVPEALTGLLAGKKPLAYRYDVPPEDSNSDADILQADVVEKYIDRTVEDTGYRLTYLDHVTNIVMLGRSWKYVYTDPDTSEQLNELVWPGHVNAFWRSDKRTIEQVTVERQMSLSDTLSMYGTTQEKIDAINLALQSAGSQGTAFAGQHFSQNNSRADATHANVVVLNHWYRTGPGPKGDAIGFCAVLMYERSDGHGKSEYGALLLERVEDSEYEDIPLHCTPRFKVPDKPPDEAYGALMLIAGLHTQYNEIFSAFRDMLWRVIYARYKAKGFTFRNAPRLIPGSAIYALPRVDQDIARIEEIVNTVPIEQFLTHLEELIIIMPGLNRYFIGSAPPSETSGEAITAAINASISRLEPIRTNIEDGERWTFRQWLAQAEAFGEYEYQGRIVRATILIEGIRKVDVHWADVSPKEATRAKQMALAGRAAGVISDDTVMDEFNVHSKADERRKIRRERQDPVLHPEHVSQTAAALTQMAMAKARMRMMQTPAAFQGPGGQQGSADEGARTAAAQAAPQIGEEQNEPVAGGATLGGAYANAVAPAPAGQTAGPVR